MASWVLVPAAEKLRDEINKIAPERDKASDGSVGDEAHAGNSSDHNPDETGNTPDEDSDSKNEVHAIDVDKDLRESFTMQNIVDYLVSECRKNNPNGKDRGRLKYIIYNGYIWDAPGWEKVRYTGSNPHDKHAHFSFEYDSQYSEDTSSWGLIEKFGDDMPTVDEIWDAKFEDPNQPGRMVKARDWLRYVPSDADVKNVGKQVTTVDDKVDQMIAALTGNMEALAQSITTKLLEQSPPGSITYEQIVSACKQAFREGAVEA